MRWERGVIPATTGLVSTGLQSTLAPQDSEIGFRDLLAFARRRAASIVISVLVFLSLGIVVVALAPREYSATTALVIDQLKVDIFGKGEVSAESTIANASVETEVQTLTSTRMSEAVVKKLGLLDDPSFMAGSPGLLDVIFRMIFPAPPAATAPPASPEPVADPVPDEVKQRLAMRRATALLRGGLEVERAGLSYVINITFTAPEPEQAARIANAFAAAYIDDKTTRQVDAAMRLSQWLESRIAEMRSQAFGSDLRAEEKAAVRATYDNFLQRYTQAVQQQSVPESEALVITSAAVPTRPSAPNPPLIIVGCLLFGFVLGSGIALLRELLDRRVRTRRQLSLATQSPCLGLLPTFRVKAGGKRNHAARGMTDSENTKAISPNPRLAVSLRSPYSQFSETLRSTRLAAERAVGEKVPVIGIVSALPGEGKTTIAGNLASLIGVSKSVLLIDADLRDPALSRTFGALESPGLVEVVSGRARLDDVIYTDPMTKLRFLPAGDDPEHLGSSEILGSAGMKELLDEARAKFEFVVLDLPPLLPVVDARAVAPYVDGFVLAVKWGATREDAVVQALVESGLEGKIVGSILNKVVLSRYRRFDPQTPRRLVSAYLHSDRRVA